MNPLAKQDSSSQANLRKYPKFLRQYSFWRYSRGEKESYLGESLKWGKMKKLIIAVIISGSLVLGSVHPAAAKSKTLEVPNVATITYPSQVKLKSEGCQTIKFRYTAPGLDDEWGYMMMAIRDQDDNQAGSFALNKGSEMILLAPQYRLAKRLGVVNVKVCREDWSENVGVKKGIYEVWFTAAGTSDSDDWPDIYGTIRFK
jgi:hypothetical protein